MSKNRQVIGKIAKLAKPVKYLSSRRAKVTASYDERSSRGKARPRGMTSHPARSRRVTLHPVCTISYKEGGRFPQSEEMIENLRKPEVAGAGTSAKRKPCSCRSCRSEVLDARMMDTILTRAEHETGNPEEVDGTGRSRRSYRRFFRCSATLC